MICLILINFVTALGAHNSKYKSMSPDTSTIEFIIAADCHLLTLQASHVFIALNYWLICSRAVCRQSSNLQVANPILTLTVKVVSKYRKFDVD